MARLPIITLDTTLADLYRQASPRNAQKRIAQVLCGVNSTMALSSNFPRNAKYLYQDRPLNTVLPSEDKSDGHDIKLQRELAMKYLSLIPQRDAFISGNTVVVLFNIDDSDKQIAHDRREAEETIAVLSEPQRPKLVFCPGPAKIPIKEEGIDLIACKLMLDDLERYNLIVPPDTQWFLNSKEALANSGLPTPKCEIVELAECGADASLCCALCRDTSTGKEFLIPTACEGARGRWFQEQCTRIYEALSVQRLPFVLKMQQTFGGAGTYIIHTETDRKKLIQDFRDGILRRLLSSITKANAHLRPGTLLLSELVAEPIGDYGLTFFVTDNGSEPIFLAASEQITDNNKAWIGSTINYSRQQELEDKFGPLVQSIASWLRRYGYIGPAGADVLETRKLISAETPRPVEDGFSQFHIVDLNVRTSGSLCLPLLRGHFASRGLYSASSFSISVQKKREAFIEIFREEFEAGRMCILSWYDDLHSEISLADVAVGAKDEHQLKVAVQSIRDATDEVRF